MTRTSLLLALALAPAAHAAAPIDTLSVDPGSHSPTIGTATLEPGTRYTMDLSGTFQITGPEGYGFKYDALYCYDGVGFDPQVAAQQCPHSGSNDTSNRSTELLVRVGTSGSWTEADKLSDHIQPYDPNHSYGFSFHVPKTGKLEAGGIYAVQDQCKGCQSNVAGGPVVIQIFGPATSGGGGSTGGGGGSTVKTVSPLVVRDDGPTQCVTARRSLAFAAANAPCPFGQVAVKAAPPSGTPVDTSSPKLKADTKSVTGFVKVDQDAVDREAGWVVDKLDSDTGNRKYRDLFEGCLLFGGAEPEADFLSIKDDRERLLYFVCAQIALGNLKGEKRRAHAAASACNAVWVPIWKAHSHPTRREYRAAVAAHNRTQKTRCQYGANAAMTYSVVARHRSLNKALGRRAGAGFISTGTPKAGGQLHYIWKAS